MFWEVDYVMVGLDPTIPATSSVHMKSSAVYILTNKPRGVLYIGVTADLARRVSEHRLASSRSFTGKYNLHHLVWFEMFEDITHAIQRETSLKRWLRAWKIDLIETVNPHWNDLSGDIGMGS